MLVVMAFRSRCPICREPVTWDGNPDRPFCSERCRLLDLAAWATERYRVPGEAAEPGADEDGGSDESGNR
jgi:endogenous inhibitor of DNA gyrase (YacG/DUF329 family)